MKTNKQLVVFGTFSAFVVLAAVACGGSDGSGGSSTQSETKGTSSSGGSSSGGSSSGGSSSGGSSSGASSSGASSSGSTGDASTSSSSGSSGASDAGYAVDSAGFKGCGHPGDQGNSIGVGKYCNSFGDCLGNSQAVLCATLGDPNAHFCTNACQQGDPTACGEKASCVCQGSQCGCFPDACK